MAKPSQKLNSYLLPLFFFCLCLLAPSGSRLEAAPGRKTNIEIKHKSRDLQKVKSAIQKKKKQQAELNKKIKNISKKVKKDSNRLRSVEKSLLFNIQKNQEVRQKLAASKIQVDQLKETISTQQGQMDQMVRSYYVSAQLAGGWAPVSAYTRQLIRTQGAQLDSLEGKKKKSQKRMTNFRQTYEVYEQEVRSQRSALSNLKSSLKNQKSRLKKTQTRQQVMAQELNELNQTAQELAGLIDILRSKAKKERAAEAKLRREKLAMGKSPIARASLFWPIKGPLTRKFGRQKHPTLGTPYISNGILIQPRQAGPVKVVSNGQVLYAGEFMSYGPMVLVEHPGDWYSVYGNLSRWAVEKGQEVKTGDVAGWSGVANDGTHQAYFELRFYGKPTDPLPWLKKGR